MKVKELLAVLPEFNLRDASESLLTLEVAAVTDDTRKVVKNSVFVAVKGSRFDTHEKLDEVAQKEACVLVVENKANLPRNYQGLILVTKNNRRALDLLASQFYGNPSLEMAIFGVTGTNGKTSSTYLMEHILNDNGIDTGVIGTINHHLKDKIWDTEMTTPGSVDLQQRLAEMHQAGARAIAMEVSSHALDQHRVDGVQFNVVMMTNLTRDHLDYHKNMQNYFEAKQRLFTDLLWTSRKIPQFAIVNIDDPWGRRMRVCSLSAFWTYGESPKANFSFKILDWDFQSLHLQIESPFGSDQGRVPLCGQHNAYNICGVVASAAALGIPVKVSLRSLASFGGIPGRLQRVISPSEKSVFLDYAHTPDALENVLKSLNKIRELKKLDCKILTLFGCGGDRDAGKRPIMAKIAEKYSDQVIVTSDNPRTEDPHKIIEEICVGFERRNSIVVEEDRKKAIGIILSLAHDQDVVLIAGKGHEDYQIIGTEKRHFSDYEVVKEFLG